jgi:hypothetical protein
MRACIGRLALYVNGFGFVNQHDGNSVSNLIEEPAVLANQAVLRLIQEYAALTFWAGQNIEQFFTNGHVLDIS